MQQAFGCDENASVSSGNGDGAQNKIITELIFHCMLLLFSANTLH